MRYNAEQFGMDLRVPVKRVRRSSKPRRPRPMRAADLPLNEEQQDWIYVQSSKLIKAALASYGV